ncbi:MAG: alcohol dehydrogenase catalytic domain-containing protein, partial [Acidimicrobiia bacterium]|nr:alcohol dehydrogenase catalytic domain-containing protein [Acidimicrobiia bacterium]
MRAAVFVEQDKPLSIEEVTANPPGPRDAVVRITASGVCHSDLSVITGGLPFPPPCILGHEGTGIVEEVGDQVTTLKKGDRVVAAFVPACGDCFYCIHDQSNLCDVGATSFGASHATRADGTPLGAMTGLGTFAETMVVEESALVKVETDLPD